MPGAHGDTETGIRGAALDLFRRQGCEKTSLREIAARPNITQAALYHHFRSKEDLLRALGGIRDVAVLIPSAGAPEHRRRAVAIATAALPEGTGGRTPGMD
ncbi:helix-turn-helix domain-containing protein [Nocardiopsis lambiniae]|uniref:Helix-turn-helix domain-containing protein n=1 Tax=Nocardiopsis lambiniae TaxID=3075539 RepID=A0ABU2M7L5_9ACTN|nr:helix-turn-helix domain-containing protein [Nocardiopsis sp. DSM 44743]MDT0327966.1 helix-turn-helix domain-containing protein [Nocardiopsis sp. DSM 44743]